METGEGRRHWIQEEIDKLTVKTKNASLNK